MAIPSNKARGAARFCTRCGQHLEERFIADEGRTRLVCSGCGAIHYINPRVVANAVVIGPEGVLLLQRAIEPSAGAWTLPGGFVEMGETAEAAAVRETREETGLDIRVVTLLGVYCSAADGIVSVTYLADIVGGAPQLGGEATQLAFFQPREILWTELAFETVAAALRDWAGLLA